MVSVECHFYSSNKEYKKRRIDFDVVCMFITYDI